MVVAADGDFPSGDDCDRETFVDAKAICPKTGGSFPAARRDFREDISLDQTVAGFHHLPATNARGGARRSIGRAVQAILDAPRPKEWTDPARPSGAAIDNAFDPGGRVDTKLSAIA